MRGASVEFSDYSASKAIGVSYRLQIPGQPLPSPSCFIGGFNLQGLQNARVVLEAILLSLLPHFPTTPSHSQYGHHNTGAASPQAAEAAMVQLFDADVPSQARLHREERARPEWKVYIVTGSNTGVGKEVAQILYSKNAKVYMVARSEDKAKRVIADIQKACAQSKGSLIFLHLDLADLSMIKPAVERFTARESKLHVLFNKAAVQALNNDGSIKTAQGYEWHFGVNVMGPFLFTKLLIPTLVAAAKSEPVNTVRVVWVCSLGTEVTGGKSHGITLDYLNYWPSLSPLERYDVTKAGNWLHGVEFAKRYEADGVVSVPCNPGHLRSDLYRDGGCMFKTVLNTLVLFPPIYGAYTEMYSGLSPTITMKDTRKWVVPWGRLYHIRQDLPDAIKPETEGGNGHAKKFWEWSEEQVRGYS